MNELETFRHDLQDLLAHLHDPDFEPSERAFAALDCAPEWGVGRLQVALMKKIEKLAATRTWSEASLNSAEIDVLQQRYVIQMTQDETARHLNMSVRTLQRVQRRAVYRLARTLWDEQVRAPVDTEIEPQLDGDWRAQIDLELASLRQTSPHAVANVAVALERVLKVGQTIASQNGVHVQTEPSGPGLMAAIHPSVLQQVLLAVIEELSQRMESGEIRLQGQREEGRIVIGVTGEPVATEGNLPNQLVLEMLAADGGTVHVDLCGKSVSLQIELPAVDEKIVVLVVDDNDDLVSFYRRYVAATTYQIVHLRDGNHLFETIDESRPDIILLDVLLPDMDGWELLTYLHENPTTRAIPTIVSSVVGSEKLALTLGAVAYLPKPVRRQEFIRTLDQVVGLARSPRAKSAAPNATIG